MKAVICLSLFACAVSAADVQTGTFGKLQLKVDEKDDPRGGVLLDIRDDLGKTSIGIVKGFPLARMVSPDGKLLALPMPGGLRILSADATTRTIKDNKIAHSYTFFEPHRLPGSGVDFSEVGSRMLGWKDIETIAMSVAEPLQDVRINVVTDRASVDVESLKSTLQIRDFNKPIELIYSGKKQDGGKPAEP